MKRLGAWIALGAVALVLTGLGAWQLGRHGQATRRAAVRQALATAPPTDGPLPAALDPDTVQRHRVDCALGDAAAWVVASPRRNGPGSRLLRSCRTPEGRRIGVDLGWVAVDDAAAALASTASPPFDGLLTIPTLRAAASSVPGPEGVPLYPPGAAASVLADWGAEPLLLVVGPPYPDEMHAPRERPVAAGWEITPPTRPHLGYAAFWLASAVLLVAQVGPKLRHGG